jgi:hypothetical protein
MPPRDAAALLTLLGHELRAPAGVVGGYLAMLDRQAPPLSADQQRAVDGAQRAQQVILAVLEDLRGLLAAWRDDAPPSLTQPVRVAELVTRARNEAGRERVTIAPAAPTDARVVVATDPTARALAAIAAAVSRTHDSAVVCEVRAAQGSDGPVGLRFLPAGGPLGAPARRPFDELRAGLGLRLPLAAAIIQRAGGDVYDLVHDERLAGVEVMLPRAPA